MATHVKFYKEDVEPNSALAARSVMTFRVSEKIKLQPGDVVVHQDDAGTTYQWQIVELLETYPSFRKGSYQQCCEINVLQPTESLATNPNPNEQN